MAKMHIERSTLINAPADKIFSVINDFNKWKTWSPWLIMDPEADVIVSNDAKSFEWDGRRTGSGNMKVLHEVKNESVTYDLNFLKPWKSYAAVEFVLKPEGDSTRVSWLMDSQLPFFLFFMKKSMEAYVGSDYERGLDMLKVYVEEGSVPSKLDFIGTDEYKGCRYFGLKAKCSIDEMDMQMERNFEKLKVMAEKNPQIIASEPFSIYHKWDVVKNKVCYTCGIPVKDIPSNLSSDFVTGEIPPAKVYKLQHTGRYQHLGNAWGTLYSMFRSKEIKINKRIHPFEVYLNDPSNTPDKELITLLHFPVK